MLVAWLASLALAAQALAAQPAAAPQEAERARAAIAAAQAAVDAAADRRALWTTAREALKDAEAAFAQQDYATAERRARFAAEQARLGIEQLGYPPFQ